jgi:glyoxylase-like metal-dependent hydrolase (beta-lactamase superfamily II)
VDIVAHVDAARAFAENAGQSLRAAIAITRERADKTEITPPTITFEDGYPVQMGDMSFEARHLGPGHSPGDIVLWLPEQSLVISGDMAFHERMPPIFVDTIALDWIETWETAFEPLGATYVIPGHGHPTNMDQVRRYTLDYLLYLRTQIGAHIEAGGDLTSAFHVDQSPYARLDTFEELATRNAGRVFEQMEFE